MKMTLIDPLKEIDRKISDIFQENPPSVNLYERDDCLFVDVQLPSYNEDEVDVKLTKKRIEITAQHFEDIVNETNSKFYMHEAKLNKQFRALNLPKSIEPQDSTAQMADGLLSIKMPIKDPAEPVRLNVENAYDKSESITETATDEFYGDSPPIGEY